MKRTYRFRIKDSTSKKILNAWSSTVNYVWNYCKDVSLQAKRRNKFLSGYDLNALTNGSSKLLELPAQTIQAIGQQFAQSRNQHKKLPRWRSYKRDLGWIPFKQTSIKIEENNVYFNGKVLHLWKTRELGGVIKCGSFSSDSRGRWYVNIVCEVETQTNTSTTSVGIDLGMKTHLTLSTGDKLTHPNLTKEYEEKLSTAQRAHKSKQVKTIHAKIKNKRGDWNHKTTTDIVKHNKNIYIGGVNTNDVVKDNTNFNKNLYDASWYQLKTMLKYKAQLLGSEYVEINEAYTSQTCSICLIRTGPKTLDVREWMCKCGVFHDRDINAALNILRLGHQTRDA